MSCPADNGGSTWFQKLCCYAADSRSSVSLSSIRIAADISSAVGGVESIEGSGIALAAKAGQFAQPLVAIIQFLYTIVCNLGQVIF